MKKSLLLAAFLLSFGCLKAQSYIHSDTSGHIIATLSDSMYHDSTVCSSTYTYWYGIEIDSSYVGDTVNVVDTSTGILYWQFVDTIGVSPWVITIPESWASTVPDYMISGGYVYFYGPVLKITSRTDTLRYLICNDSLQVTNPCQYSTVSGYVFDDFHGDCTYDSGDVGFLNVAPTITENLSSGAGPITYSGTWAAIGANGYYSYQIQQSWMVNYIVAMPAYYSFIFPSSTCFTAYAPFSVLPDTGINFPLQCSSACDLQCNALAPASIRFGRPFYVEPYVSNTGCDTQSGEFTFILDSRVIYDSALSTYPPDTVRGDTLIWNYSGLTNLAASGTAYWNNFISDIFLSLDSSVAVGDTLCFSGYTDTPATDINPLNNAFSFCVPVVYSYDPNSKVVSPQGMGTQGYIPGGPDTLTYTLHFQNTGSSYAEDINVIDTLDPHINAASLKILGTSANMIPQWLAPGIVEFSFNEIYLPDSGDNYAASQGAVQFSVALNAGLTPGTQIHNTGYIYFDANPAVVTNTTLNTIDTTTVPTSINQVPAKPAVKVYPNPATDVVYVENMGDGEISIMNISGTVVIQQTVVNNLTTIDVSALPGGVYILKTVSNANTTTTKFTKY